MNLKVILDFKPFNLISWPHRSGIVQTGSRLSLKVITAWTILFNIIVLRPSFSIFLLQLGLFGWMVRWPLLHPCHLPIASKFCSIFSLLVNAVFSCCFRSLYLVHSHNYKLSWSQHQCLDRLHWIYYQRVCVLKIAFCNTSTTHHEKSMPTVLSLHHVQNTKLTQKLYYYIQNYSARITYKSTRSSVMDTSVYQRPIKCDVRFLIS